MKFMRLIASPRTQCDAGDMMSETNNDRELERQFLLALLAAHIEEPGQSKPPRVPQTTEELVEILRLLPDGMFAGVDEPESPEAAELAGAIAKRGRCILSRSYDTGGMAGGGRDAIYELEGRYAVDSLDFGTKGPYATFEEAANDGEVNILNVATSITDFESDVWSAEEITRRISLQYLHGDDVVDVTVNGEEWFVSRDGWRRME